MKTKLFKRVGTLILACVMCLSFCTTAFATESTVTVDENSIMPRENHAEIQPNESVTFTLGTLTAETNNPKITFITASKAAGPNIPWRLRNATYNHDNVANGTVGVNTMHTETIWGLSRGRYEIIITNTAAKPVTVYVYFE